MMADEKRRVTMTVTVALETSGDASLNAIARAYEKTPALPFVAGATNPMGTSVCTVTRLHVTDTSEQDQLSCRVCGHADGNHTAAVCQIPGCECEGQAAA